MMSTIPRSINSLKPCSAELVLARRQRDAVQIRTQRQIVVNILGRKRFFEPKDIRRLKLGHQTPRLGERIACIAVDLQADLRTDRFPKHSQGR